VFNVLKTCRHGLMVYNRNDVYIGRSLDLYGEFSQGEIELFQQVVGIGDVVIEVGANIGAHTLRLAQLAGPGGRVHAFEPQRPVFQTLCANLALNSIVNTHCYMYAVGSQEGELPVPVVDYEEPNNFGGIELGDDAEWRSVGWEVCCEVVPLVTLDFLFAGLDRLRLLKVDVEGMELEVLRGARELIQKTRPFLYVENDRPAKSEALVDLLRSLGYALYWHDPLLYNPENHFGNAEDVFPGVLSINIFGIPQGSGSKLDGFRPVESPLHPALGR
jgi:FkbM family methyltransferase